MKGKILLILIGAIIVTIYLQRPKVTPTPAPQETPVEAVPMVEETTPAPTADIVIPADEGTPVVEEKKAQTEDKPKLEPVYDPPNPDPILLQ